MKRKRVYLLNKINAVCKPIDDLVDKHQAEMKNNRAEMKNNQAEMKNNQAEIVNANIRVYNDTPRKLPSQQDIDNKNKQKKLRAKLIVEQTLHKHQADIVNANIRAYNDTHGKLPLQQDIDNKNKQKKLMAEQKRQKCREQCREQYDGNFSEDEIAEGKAYKTSNLASQINQSHYKESKLANQKDKGKVHTQDRDRW